MCAIELVAICARIYCANSTFHHKKSADRRFSCKRPAADYFDTTRAISRHLFE